MTLKTTTASLPALSPCLKLLSASLLPGFCKLHYHGVKLFSGAAEKLLREIENTSRNTKGVRLVSIPNHKQFPPRWKTCVSRCSRPKTTPPKGERGQTCGLRNGKIFAGPLHPAQDPSNVDVLGNEAWVLPAGCSVRLRNPGSLFRVLNMNPHILGL